MKKYLKNLVIISYIGTLALGCGSDDGPSKPDGEGSENSSGSYEMVDVKVVMPAGSTVDLASTTLVSLGSDSEVNSDGKGILPFNKGSVELGYVLDSGNHVLLLGFLSDERKEISVRTTAEVMLYYGLDYYVLPASAKSAFLKNVSSLNGFDELVGTLENLFVSDPLMYDEGAYQALLDAKVTEITSKKGGISASRLFMNEPDSKSGLSISKIDSADIKIQNIQPRRTKVFIYKKDIFDRNGNPTDIPNYRENPYMTFDFEPGKQNQITDLEVGNSLSQVTIQNSSIENASTTDIIPLPVNPANELVADYEVVIIGPGVSNPDVRDMSGAERQAYEKLSEETYVLDYFLPTLLDIGGNKAMLPPFGSSMEDGLFKTVSSVLNEYPEVLEAVYENDFKAATKEFLPALYGDVRLNDDLRVLLKGVYRILTDEGNAPNTFIQTQELVETGYARTQLIMAAIDKNIPVKNYYQNFDSLKTGAHNMETWTISSIDALVEFYDKELKVCLGESAILQVHSFTAYEPEVEDLEYHWTTSNHFKGRVQDINDDPNNFGASIITKSNAVSYISAALESELGSGDNLETVTVVIYAKNRTTGELGEVGHDTMTVNNQKGCTSFFVPFEKEVLITTFTSELLCGGGPVYTVNRQSYLATFKAKEGAVSYKGRILRMDGTYGDEFNLTVEEAENDMLEYRLGVGPLYILQTCSEAEAEQEKQKRLNDMDQIGHQGVEVTPIF